LGPPTWDELTRLPLDEPIEGERALEAVAALLVVQWRHFNLTREDSQHERPPAAGTPRVASGPLT